VLNNKPGKWYGKVIPESPVTDHIGNSPAVTGNHFLFTKPTEKITRIEYPEKQLVPLLPVFTKKRGEVFKCRRFNGYISIKVKNCLYGIENMISPGHLDRQEVSCSFRYGRFLRHIRRILFQCPQR